MFKAKDVTGILQEGRDWVSRLEVAAEDALDKANAKEVEIQVLENQRVSLANMAREGKAVASNFLKLLEVDL